MEEEETVGGVIAELERVVRPLGFNISAVQVCEANNGELQITIIRRENQAEALTMDGISDSFKG